MKKDGTELRWGVERRLEFIEFRLYWEGGINRSDIIDFFGVSVPQASKDLSQYQNLAPGNIYYDKSEKRYFVSDEFIPRFFTPDPERYLSQLRLIAEQIIPAEETWLSNLPSLDAMPVPHRRINAVVLRTLLHAIRTGGAAEIHYQSMNPQRPEPIWRAITPHALATDGLRWHARAYCHIEGKFKDFLISRCLNCRIAGEPMASARDDHLWKEFFPVRLMPNPELSPSQQNIISEDYTMTDSLLEIPVRKALLYYFQKRMRLDVAEALDNPQECPVVIANKAEFQNALKEATG